MKSYRIGNDHAITWHIKRNGEDYDLTGRNIVIEISTSRAKFRLDPSEYRIEGNRIIWIFYGKDQRYLGPYSFTYIENEGDAGMITFDRCDVFCLVSCSCKESGINDEDVEISDIDFESDLASAKIKLPEITPGANGNWWIDGIDTGQEILPSMSLELHDSSTDKIINLSIIGHFTM